MDISETVNQTILSLTQTDEPIQCSLRLKEDLGMDSLALTRLIVELEECLNIEIDLSLLITDNLETVDDIRRLAEKSMG